MCSVCKLKGKNSFFKKDLYYTEPIRFYGHKTNQGKPLEFYFCHLHSIELFKLGERRFLHKYRQFKSGVEATVEEINKKQWGIFFEEEPRSILVEVIIKDNG
jgi:hypothetical protein